MKIAFWRTPLYVLIAATLIVMISIGIRQSFGLFMKPMSEAMGWGYGVLSFALATQNLLIGLAAPFIGVIADRWGPIRVIMTAGAIYGIGVLLMGYSDTPLTMALSAGVMVGLAVSGCGLSLLLALVGRVAPDNQRSMWLGIVTAGATAGQMLVPAVQGGVGALGWEGMMPLLALLAALIVPLAYSLSSGSAEALSRKTSQSMRDAIGEAANSRSYWLLVVAFMVCGFHVQFIVVHIPAYLANSGADPWLGAEVIAVIGFFNMLGTWISGWLGGRYHKPYLLSLIFFLRSAAILAFISLPLSEYTIYAFGAAMGLLWLSTVPLTSGIVAQMFGTRYMATLYSVVYLSHQVGAFLGVYLGGKVYDATGSYEIFWWVAIAVGLLAAAMHLPIDDRPVARVAQGE